MKETIKTPKELNKYIKVTKVSTWLMTFAIVIFLLGIIAWANWGSLGTSVEVISYTENGETSCYIQDVGETIFEENMAVKIGKSEGTIELVPSTPKQYKKKNSNLPDYVVKSLSLSDGDFYREIKVDIENVEDGGHVAKITVKKIRPLDYLVYGGTEDE